MEVRPGYKQTEVGAIPNDWGQVCLKEISTQITDGDHITPNRTRDGYYLLSARNVRDGIIDLSDVDYVGDSEFKRMRNRCAPHAGDLLISCSGHGLGRVAIVPNGLHCVLVRSAALVKIDHNKADSLYVQYWLQGANARKQISDTLSRAAQPNLFLNSIEKLRSPLPSLPEQRAIATALSEVDALLGALDRLIAKKRDLKQAAMQQLLTGQTRLPGFHGQWEVRGLLTLAHIAQGQVNPKQEPFRSKYLVGPVHVESGTGKLLNRQTAAEQGAISGKYLFERGDIVYGKINPYLKKAFLAEFQGLCSADMYPLRPAIGVASGYLLAVILGDEFTKYAVSVSVRSGMPKINREEMAGFSARIPKSFAEQTAIAEVLSDMDAEIAALEQRREKTRALKQGMMQELLTGKTRLVES